MRLSPIIQAFLIAVFSLIFIEITARIVKLNEQNNHPPISLVELLSTPQKIKIFHNEISNQTIVHNLFLFQSYPEPEEVEVAYVGTSRTKVFRPSWYGNRYAVVGAGNSYSEITYGLLLQAEILRRKFKNLKTVYIESSLLLRKPNRFFVEPDHEKYLPLLQSLLPIIKTVPLSEKIATQIDRKSHDYNYPTNPIFERGLEITKMRNQLKISELLNLSKNQGIAVHEDTWIKTLRPNGERNYLPSFETLFANQKPPIQSSHIKVQRLTGIQDSMPWDGLFEVIAEWGKVNKLNIVFFQPPVRSDLYAYQVELGLDLHNRELKRVAQKYGFSYINLNQPQLGYTKDWTLFSDEDHMETCKGVVLLHYALEQSILEGGKEIAIDEAIIHSQNKLHECNK